jgi:hypothetical protein
LRKSIAYQEVPVAGLKINPRATLGQGSDLISDFTIGGGKIIVAKIGIKEIAEDK